MKGTLLIGAVCFVACGGNVIEDGELAVTKLAAKGGGGDDCQFVKCKKVCCAEGEVCEGGQCVNNNPPPPPPPPNCSPYDSECSPETYGQACTGGECTVENCCCPSANVCDTGTGHTICCYDPNTACQPLPEFPMIQGCLPL